MDLSIIILIILALILTLLVALLLIPVKVRARVRKEGALTQFNAVFKVLYGLASGELELGPETRCFYLKILAITVYTRDLEKEEKEEEEKERKPIAWGKIIENAGGLIDAFVDLIRALVKHITLKEIRGEVKVGMSDPSLTGMICGLLYACNGIANTYLPKADLSVESHFERQMLDAELGITIQISIIWLIIPLISLYRRMRKISA